MKHVQVIHQIAEMRALSENWRCQHQIIGLVPTMGALHEGHLSLIRRARAQCDQVVVSVFVNPTQFGPQEDYSRYPRMLEADCKLAADAGADAVFAPEAGEVYPIEPLTSIHVARLSETMCGLTRPTHFAGVCTVVSILFNVVRPHKAYFGLKDYQQYIIIKRMSADLHQGVEIAPCPLVREPDGLALSSRNQYLDSELRKQALVLYHSLKAASEAAGRGVTSADELLQIAGEVLDSAPAAKVDYVVLVDPENLEPVDELVGPALLAEAVWLGETRLLDNMVIEPGK